MSDPALLPTKYLELNEEERKVTLESCIILALTMRKDGSYYTMPVVKRGTVKIEDNGVSAESIKRRVDRYRKVSQKEWEEAFISLIRCKAIYCPEMNYSEPENPVFRRGRFESQMRYYR